MVLCIVACCTPRDRQNLPEPVSTFLLPQCPITREVWLKAIGKVNMPRVSIERARICSRHFTADSYREPDKTVRIKSRKFIKKRLRLLPHAVPTLNLKPVLNDTTEVPKTNSTNEAKYPKLKVIVRKFEFPINGVSSLKNKPNDNIDKNILNNETQTIVSDKNFTPETDINPYPVTLFKNQICELNTEKLIDDKDLNATESRNLQSNSSDHVENLSLEIQDVYSIGTPVEPELPRRLLNDVISEDFEIAEKFMEEEEDSHVTVTSLKAELQYHQTTARSYKNTIANVRKEWEKAKIECSELTSELMKKEMEQKRIASENEELKKSNEDLCARLAAAETEKIRWKENQQNIVKTLLEPYHTKEQIQCIVEGWKREGSSVDGYC